MASRSGTMGLHGRRLSCIILVVLFLFTAAAAAAYNTSRTITVRGDNNYPPYEFTDENGQPAGWNIDLVRAVAEAEGLNISISLGPWDEVRGELESGRIDMLAGMYYSPERARLVNFTTPHIIVSHAIFVRKGSDIRSVADLEGKTVLVQRGDIMDDYLTGLNITNKIVRVENQQDALILLSKGEYDAALVAKLQGIYNAGVLDLSNIDTTGDPIESRDYCFAVSPQNSDIIPALNEGLAIVKASGQYDLMYEKWFGVHERLQESLRLWSILVFILLPGAGLLVLALLWTWSLRRQVAKKTDELSRELARSEKAEAGLRQSEERTTAILAALPDLLFILSRDGIFLDYHVPDQAVLMMDRKSIIGNSVRSAGFDPAVSDEILLAIKKALDSGTLEYLQYSIILAGRPRHYEARLTRLDPARVLGIVRDVTEQKIAEIQLRENQRVLATLMGNLPGMAYRCRNDPSWTMEFVSQGCYDLTGYRDSALLWNQKVSYADLIHPDDRSIVWDAVQEGVTHHRPFMMIYRIRTEGGEVKWVWEQGCGVFSAGGELEALEGFITDINEKKLAEEELKKKSTEIRAAYEQLAASEEELRENYTNLAITEQRIRASERRLSDIISFLPDATFAIDSNGVVIIWNRAIEDMTGVPALEMLGKGDHEYSIPFYGERRPILINLIFEDTAMVASRYQNVKREGDALVGEAWVPAIYEGKGAYLWGISSPLYDADGNITGAIESIRDITDRRTAHDALAQARKKLSILNTVTFQDIRNAVFSFSAYLELEKDIVTEDRARYFLAKQASIVSNISGSLKFAEYYQSLGLNPPRWQNVTQVFLLAISHLDISRLSRRMDVDTLEIYADPLLENVFFTLVENALLHGTSATEIRLVHEHADNELILVVEDNGLGIPADRKEIIFERGYDGKKGMGLFLSREILSITGITIHECGEQGKGARFEIIVPDGMWRVSTPE